MDTILIVDDNETLLPTLVAGIASRSSEFEIVTAENGRTALDIFKSKSVSLLITDLEMPVMDGLELLAYVCENHAETSCIAMTGYPDSEKMKRLSGSPFRLITKPFMLDDFTDIVTQTMKERAPIPGDVLNGVSVVNFLQLIGIETKTCLLEIQAHDKSKGVIYFEKGMPFNAVYGNLKGEDAACALAALDNAKIRFKNFVGTKKVSRRIRLDVMALCMKALRRKEETQIAGKGGDNPDGADSSKEIANNRESSGEKDPITSGDRVLSAGEKAGKTQIHYKEDLNMALEKYIHELKDIKGYKASGVMDFTGDLLAHDSADPNIDLAIVAATFNDIFRSAHEASRKVQLGSAHDLVLKAPDGVIVMVCSGVDAETHFHIIGVLEADGNAALMKMKLEKIVPSIMDELK